MMTIFLVLAQSAGIAAEYPGDEGIEKDRRVLFVEDFETGTLPETGARWGNIGNRNNLSYDRDLHANSPGVRSLRIRKNGHLFARLKGVDTMFARYYLKFHPKMGYNHHFVHLIADRYPTPWPKGGAGLCPGGDRKFTTGLEPQGQWGRYPAPGKWGFYSYWHKMKGSRGGKYWGNVFRPEEQELIEAGRWYCMEVMLKANSKPDLDDGEQAFWVDGEKLGHFRNIHWRTHDAVKVNSFKLLFYNTDQPARHNRDKDAANRVMEVWFDDVVLATEYIGPIQGAPKNGKKAAVLDWPKDLPSLPEKVLFSEAFDEGMGKWKGGSLSDGALSFPRKITVWGAFSAPVTKSTTVRFRLKPLVDVGSVMVMSWSEKIKDNGRYYVTRLRKGMWNEVRFRAADIRQGMELDGPSIEGGVFNNITLMFNGSGDAPILIDDFEIRE